METVKTLLENTKQNLELELWWAEEHDKEPQHIEEIPILKQKIVDIDEALLRLFSVVGQSEQFYCSSEEDNKAKCETQCLGCAELEEQAKQ
jgi:hypothetical protein